MVLYNYSTEIPVCQSSQRVIFGWGEDAGLCPDLLKKLFEKKFLKMLRIFLNLQKLLN